MCYNTLVSEGNEFSGTAEALVKNRLSPGSATEPRKKVKKTLDKQLNKCYNEYTEKGRESQATPSPIQKVQKLLKKVLDKQYKMCYNKNVKRNTSYRIKKLIYLKEK